MPIRVNEEQYYQTSEACAMAGVSRVTFLRWVREGVFGDVKYRDRRGWRLFTDDDVAKLKAWVNKIERVGNYQETNG